MTTTRLTDDQLQAIREGCEGVTPGPYAGAMATELIERRAGDSAIVEACAKVADSFPATDQAQQNKIETIGLDGVRWYLWRGWIADRDLGAEVLRALQTYPKVRVNGAVYCKEAEAACSKPEGIWDETVSQQCRCTFSESPTLLQCSDHFEASALVTALETIRDSHLGDQPMTSEVSEYVWAQRHIAKLRRVAKDTLAAAQGRLAPSYRGDFYADAAAILALAPPAPAVTQEPITVTYTNYRGETAARTITPRSVRHGSTEWHPEPQWLLLAYDHDKQADREFALKDFGAPAVTLTQEQIAKVLWLSRGGTEEAFKNHRRRGFDMDYSHVAEALRDAAAILAAQRGATDAGAQAHGPNEALVKALNDLHVWCENEGCGDQAEIIKDAFKAAGITEHRCANCNGLGEWDEGPLPARSSTQISPDYRHMVCSDCDGKGTIALSRPERLPTTGEA